MNILSMISILALCLYTVLLTVTVIFPSSTLFQKSYTLSKDTRSSSFGIQLLLNEDRINIDLRIGTLLTFVGALVFGIGTFLLAKWNRRMEFIVFCSIFSFGSFSYYIYIRAISFNNLLQYYEGIFKNTGITVVARSDTSILIPTIIFISSLCSWFISIWLIRFTEISYKETENNGQVQIHIIPSQCKEYNSVFGVSLMSVCPKIPDVTSFDDSADLLQGNEDDVGEIK